MIIIIVCYEKGKIVQVYIYMIHMDYTSIYIYTALLIGKNIEYLS